MSSNRKENILHFISAISDPKFQIDVWIKGKYFDEATSFDETVNRLDDLGFFAEIREGKVALDSPEDLVIIKRFIQKLEEYDKANDTIEMLESHEWHDVILTARTVKEILEKHWSC